MNNFEYIQTEEIFYIQEEKPFYVQVDGILNTF